MELENRIEYHEVIIVGAGPSGLSAAYALKMGGIDYCVLERNTLLGSWRRERWDSFTLVTPNWMTRLPGMENAATKDNRYMTLEEINDLLTEWVVFIKPMVLEGVEAIGLKKIPEHSDVDLVACPEAFKGRARFELETSVGTFWARHVIVACGQYNKPVIPNISTLLPENILQLHSQNYKNPDQLISGEVLVVGGGRSGIQIALELKRAGRKVWLALGKQSPIPAIYDNINGVYWLNRLSGFAQSDIGIEYNLEDFENLQIVEKLKQTLATCQMEGIVLLGRLTGYCDGQLRFDPNLKEILDASEKYLKRFNEAIETHRIRGGLKKPEKQIQLEPMRINTEHLKEVKSLELKETGIKNLIWATGYRPDYHWIKLPVFGPEGQIVQQKGSTEIRGLYFAGVELNPGFGGPSAFGIGFYSFGEDARTIVDAIVAEEEG